MIDRLLSGGWVLIVCCLIVYMCDTYVCVCSIRYRIAAVEVNHCCCHLFFEKKIVRQTQLCKLMCWCAVRKLLTHSPCKLRFSKCVCAVLRLVSVILCLFLNIPMPVGTLLQWGLYSWLDSGMEVPWGFPGAKPQYASVVKCSQKVIVGRFCI